ncbi:hypothetical protein [Pseudonocardia sp.]|uniref:hypothetical protein n=1 Tax=Pseudonocardia sp. TaxID=60912 RepID=UPI003D14A9D1
MTAVPALSAAHRLLAPWYVDGTCDDLDAHHRRHGPRPVLDVRELADLADAAGLRGRGGAGFPTATKLRAVAAARRHPIRRSGPVVVANGCEGEPASRKDAQLLRHSPHLVLDGIALAADALGATDTYLCVHADGTELRDHAAHRDDPVPVQVVEVEPRYVASEESPSSTSCPAAPHSRPPPRHTPPSAESAAGPPLSTTSRPSPTSR